MNASVLVVDDSSFIVEGMVSILERHDYRAMAAHSGEECLKILESETPDIIILDILMEPMDGWETLVRIRKDSRTRRVPVLLFSAKKISIEEAETYRVSIDDFIAKPIVPKTLISAIDRTLSRHAGDRRLTESWRGAGVPEETIDAYLSVRSEMTIDTQLLAVLKRQAGLCAGDEDTCRGLEKAMGEIADRIARAKARLEEISAGLPPAGDSIAGPVPVAAAETAAQQSFGETAGPAPTAPQDAPQNDRPETPEYPAGNARDDAPAGMPGPAPQAGPDPTGPARDLFGSVPDITEPPAHPAAAAEDGPAAAKPVRDEWAPVFYTGEPEIPPAAVPVPRDDDFLFEDRAPEKTPARPVPVPADTPVPGDGSGAGDDRASVPDEPAAAAHHSSDRSAPEERGGFFSRLIASLMSVLRGLKLRR